MRKIDGLQKKIQNKIRTYRLGSDARKALSIYEAELRAMQYTLPYEKRPQPLLAKNTLAIVPSDRRYSTALQVVATQPRRRLRAHCHQ